jgi:hypothetical protein
MSAGIDLGRLAFGVIGVLLQQGKPQNVTFVTISPPYLASKTAWARSQQISRRGQRVSAGPAHTGCPLPGGNYEADGAIVTWIHLGERWCSSRHRFRDRFWLLKEIRFRLIRMAARMPQIAN